MPKKKQRVKKSDILKYMKNFFVFLFLFIYIFTLSIKQIYAQTPSISVCNSTIPVITAPIPGVSCGNVNDPCTNRCCVNKPQEYKKDLPVISDVVKTIGIPNPMDFMLKFQTQINVEPCINGSSPSTPGDLLNSGCICIKPTEVHLSVLVNLCENIKDGGEKTRCVDCLKGTGQLVGVWTGMGCMRANIGTFIQETLLGWGVGLAGGISLLCIMYAAFMMQTSGGEAEKIKKAQQLMTSCITGLMLIIFSVFILQLIGVKILRIPGFQ